MRHGATEWNLKGIVMGHADIPLHPQGIQEAQDAVIPHDEITHVFYSPLQRAVQTMHIVTRQINCPKEELHGIQERHIGDLAGKPRAAIIEDLKTLTPLGGETHEQFRERLVAAINNALAKSDCPLFISHGGVFRAIKELLNIEHASLNNCELVKFVPCHQSGRWHIEKHTRGS